MPDGQAVQAEAPEGCVCVRVRVSSCACVRTGRVRVRADECTHTTEFHSVFDQL